MEVYLELMGKILDLPILERPREKALRYGISSLADHELLALIIGKGSKKQSALELGFSLLSDKGGIVNLFQSEIKDLTKYNGISKATALKFVSLFELTKRYEKKKNVENETNEEIDNHFIYLHYRNELINLPNERLILIILNGAKKVIHEATVFIGSENEMPASTREIIGEILASKGKSFYIVHNHPNGNKNHSSADLVFIDQLIYEAKKMNLRLIDSIVISSSGFSSYYQTIEGDI